MEKLKLVERGKDQNVSPDDHALDVKAWLQSCWESQVKLRRLRERRAYYLDMASSVSGMSETNIRTNNKRSRVETAALELVDLSDRLDEQAEKLARRIAEAEVVLSRMENNYYRELLVQRYLYGLSWSAIRERLNSPSDMALFKAHGRALQAAQPIYEALQRGDFDSEIVKSS